MKVDVHITKVYGYRISLELTWYVCLQRAIRHVRMTPYIYELFTTASRWLELNPFSKYCYTIFFLYVFYVIYNIWGYFVHSLTVY